MDTLVLDAVGVSVLDALWILIPTGLFIGFGWWMVKWLGKEFPKEVAYGEEYPKWLQPPSETNSGTIPPHWAVIRGGKRGHKMAPRPRRKMERHHSSS
ncbi:hypothetical protein [Sulfobacillus thermosulfidooxidans]|uniref:Uncharacterized protein n=2 Tax=Sulfobacillus thermosulfidooxidans TaxID=28034 RepID=A0A1W1W7I2_SULTA|nr:hypothetical protein [Sulfobacillus thermosulfidooxidans]OLZ08194.1 hypothetical protein BFX05_05335 [Sulfobacillus thermosulfidooxidans]OLZ14946.1 hypothetical protein BFX06_04915 [Sulfobacillus thermosulfidooxidans]OLZ19695.1 hypothetical protein BFX07_03295 [Sulfobacillus thermosulfidooxidans]PSR27860.1 MAG: hypothetical protein C7B47_07155 [Sulfobacillus thermosulfidooxidans]SMC02261.1 hypothetical protein SAMN00768000_0482 [Sulfobacillus thermosulfidooxidans DSM 9293]